MKIVGFKKIAPKMTLAIMKLLVMLICEHTTQLTEYWIVNKPAVKY